MVRQGYVIRIKAVNSLVFFCLLQKFQNGEVATSFGCT